MGNERKNDKKRSGTSRKKDSGCAFLTMQGRPANPTPFREGLSRQIDDLLERVARWRSTGEAKPSDAAALVPQLTDELATLMEELHTAGETLSQQNEELAGAHVYLEEERRRYQELFDLAPDGYLVTDAQGVILEANQAAARLLRVPPDFLGGKSLSLYLGRGSRKDFQDLIAQASQGEPRLLEIELQVKPVQAAPFPAAVSAVASRDTLGRLQGLLWLLRDITLLKAAERVQKEHRQSLEEAVRARTAELQEVNDRLQAEVDERLIAEEELRQQNEELVAARAALETERHRYLELFEFAPAGYLVTSLEGGIQEANRHAAALLNQSPAELNGLNLTHFVAPESRDDFTACLARMRAGESDEVLDWDVAMQTGEGRGFPGAINVRVMREAQGRRTGLRWLVRDITDRKRAEETVRASEERYRIVADNTYDWEFWRDPDGRFLYCSPSCQRHTGYSAEEFIADPILLDRLILPDDLAAFQGHLNHEDGQQHPVQIQFRIRRPNGTEVWIEHLCRPMFDAQGRFLGERGSNRDITERKQTEAALLSANQQLQDQKEELEAANEELTVQEEELRVAYEELRDKQEALVESERRYRELVKYAPAAIYELDFRRQKFVTVNDALCQITGYTREELLTMNPFDLLDEPGKALFQKRINQWLSGEEPDEQVEFRVNAKDGREVYAALNVTFTLDEQGRPLGATVIGHDVTERKRAEEALRASEANIRSIAENIPSVLMRYNREMQVVYLSPQAEAITGIPISKFLGHTNREVGMPEDLCDQWEAALEQVFHSSEGQSLEFDLPTAQEVRTFLLKFVPEFDSDRLTVRHVLGISTDITERKRAEEALRQAHERTSAILESISDSFLAMDEDWRITFINQRAIGYGKRPLDEVLGKTIWEAFPAILGTPLEEFYRQTMQSRRALTYVNPSVVAPGAYFELHAYPFGNGLSVFGQDITERKRAEEALRESEERYRAFFRSSIDAILITTPEGGIEAANSEACRLFGMTEAELIQAGRWGIQDETDPRIPQALAERARTGRFRGDLNLKRKDGTIFPGEISTALYNAEKGAEKTAMIIRDVTERKRMEEALRRSEEKYRSLFEQMGEGFVVGRMIYDDQGNACDYQFVEANPAYERLTGLPRELSLQKTIRELIPTLEPPWIEQHARVAETGESCHWESYNEQVGRHYSIHSFQPGPGMFASVFTDITDNKKAEQTLRESEERFRVMADSSPFMIWVTDTRGDVQFVNRAYQEFFGVTLEQVLGPGWQPLVHPEDHEAYVQGFLTAVWERRPFSSEARVRHADGQWRWIMSVGEPRFSPDGEYLGHVGSSPDITEMRQSEERIQASLDEKVVLLKEIHHRVKNNLQIVSALLGLQRGRIKDPAMEIILRDSQSRIRSIALVHEKLYRSRDLARVDLAEYLTVLTSSLLQSYGARDRVTLEIDADPLSLDVDTILPCGLVVNELVSNALKHAFPEGRQGLVRILLKEAGGIVRLIVEDDGVGLPPGLDYHKSDSLGLQLIHTLAQQLNATVNMAAGPGTRVTIEIPLESAAP
ncbi:MAG: PAS domain S-box protein [Candidatus Zixiibacteriota bacterium]|nr:MAG: PAS domain S-box protein [candidate division Zixibacteria bacterium]